MSLTPGWQKKTYPIYWPVPKLCEMIKVGRDFYYLDNESEIKKYPATPQGWSDLCDDLKEFEP